MSLNIGQFPSRYVKVYEPRVKFNVSENIVFADLLTSKKDYEFDYSIGEYIMDDATKEKKVKYTHSRWPNARFVGKALEGAKALPNGSKIDIVNGWIESSYDKEKERAYLTVVITEFVMSQSNTKSDDPEAPEEASEE